jgi:hypothetical protein
MTISTYDKAGYKVPKFSGLDSSATACIQEYDRKRAIAFEQRGQSLARD